TNNNQEVSNEINGIFSIKPPGMNFVLPPYNVWSPHELYEDFDGVFELKWVKSIPDYDYQPSGQFKLHMTDDVPIYGNMLVFNPPKNIGTTTFNTIDFTRYYVPGYHTYKLWVRGFDVDSDIAELRVNVLKTPKLSEHNSSGGVLFINEYDKLKFKVSDFISTQTLLNHEKIIMRLYIKKALSGAAPSKTIDFNYNSSGIYELDYNQLPSFTKNPYIFSCQFFKVNKNNPSTEYDRSNQSNSITIDFKEYIKIDAGVYAKDLGSKGKDDYGNCTPYFVFYNPSKNLSFKYNAKTNSLYPFKEETKTGQEIRNSPMNNQSPYKDYFNKPGGLLRGFSTSEKEKEDQKLKWDINIIIKDSGGNEVKSYNINETKKVKHGFEKNYYYEF
ncbi:MAG: hypothetical protein M0R46_17900, partial [Candidatus Muirbacterium halophilum]|nr:hypothetical protein [Candidatus Muirbacterium halophilum]